MEGEQKLSSDDINQAAREDTRKYYAHLKIIPFLVIYQIWPIAIKETSGWPAAVPAWLLTGAFLVNWPRGIWRKVLFAFVMAMVLPVVISFMVPGGH